MPLRPSGLLKPATLSRPAGLGGVAGDPASPFLPTEEDILAQQEALQAEDEPNLLFKLLQIPERLLGGQSVKAFLKGTAEGGVLEGLSGAFRNNPVFQILDALPGVDIVEDVSFQDVREAVGEDFLKTDNQFGQLLIDIAGEVLTDPLGLFWTPFAKVPGFAGKVSKDLGTAVEEGAKTLLAFKVPVVGTEFVVPTFKSFDVFTARALQGMANFVNTNPVTKEIIRLFNPKQIGLADPAARAQAGKALDEAQIAERWFGATFMPLLNKSWINLPDEVKQDQELVNLFLQMVETGVKGSDDLSTVVAKVQAGRPFHLAQRARDDLLENLKDTDIGADILKLLDQVGEDGKGIGVLAETWQEAYPAATLPEKILGFSDDVLEREGVVLRPGVDTRDVGQGAPSFIDPEIKDAVPTTVRSREVVQRSDIAEDTSGVLEDVLNKVRDEDIPDALSKVLNKEKGPELLQAIQKSSEDFLRLADEVGDADKLAGILRGTLETYFPRDLSPEVWDAIKKQVNETDFAKGRKLEELTIVEANALLLDYGVKATGFRSVKDLTKDPSAINKLWTTLFPDKWVETLKELGPSGRKAAEFFNTNPLRAWYRRIEKSAEIRGLRRYTDVIFEEGSPLVAKRTNLDWILKTPDEVQQLAAEGYRAVIRTAENDLGAEVLSTHTLLEKAFNLDAKAKGKVAEQYIARWVDRELEAGKSFDDVAKELRVLRDTTLRHKSLLKPGAQARKLEEAHFQDTVAAQSLKTERVQKRIKTLDEDLRTLEKTPFADHPLVKTLRRQRDTLVRWEDAAFDALSPTERKLLDAPTVDIGAEKLVQERISRLTEIKTERNAVAKRLAELRKRRKAIGKDPAQVIQRGLIEQEIQKTEQRLTRLRAATKGQDTLLRKAKEALRGGKKARKELQEEIRKKGLDARNALFDDLSQKEKILRQAVQDEIDRTLAQGDAVKQAILGLGKESSGRVAAAVGRQVGEDTTKNLNDYLRLYRKQKESGVLALDEIEQKFPDLYQNMLAKNGSTEVFFLDGQVYNELFDKEASVISRLNAGDPLKGHLGWLDSLTQVWKGWTVLPPVFVKTRLRDMLSGALMQFQGGTTPAQLGVGSKHVRGFLKALGKVIKGTDFDALKKLDIAPELLDAVGAKNAEELMQFAYAHGVINNGLVRDAGFDAAQDVAVAAARAAGEQPRNAAQAVVDGFSKTFGSRSLVIQAGADVAEAGDNTIKLSAFFGRLLSGEDPEAAAQAVRAWSYDPRLVDLSQFEKTVVRRLIPFYSWTKQAVKSQVNAYFTRPGTVAIWEKIGRAANNLTDLSPVEWELVMPEFIKDNFGLPVHQDPDGTIKVRLLGGLIPLFEAGRIADALADTFDPDAKGGLGQQILLNMNPLIKVPLENGINESFYTQRKLEDFPGETEAFLGIEMDPKLRHTLQAIRFLKEIDDLNILDLSQIAAIFKVEGKDLRDIVDFSDAGAVPQPFRAPTSAADRLFSGGFGFNPLQVGNVKFISSFEQARRKEASLKLERNRVRGQLNRLLRLREAGGRVTPEELDAVKELLAKKTAELRIVQGVETRLQGSQ